LTRPALLLIPILVATAACSAPDSQPARAAAEPTSAGPGVVAGTAPSGAIIALMPAAGDAPMPEGPAVMDQYSKTFVPNLLYVRVGQPVEFRNSEDMPHNVSVTRRGSGTEIFSVSTEPQQKYVHTFDRTGQFDVTCDIHPGMQALVVAAPSALATIADERGAFSIANVPAGSYKVALTFEGRTVERTLEVKGPRTEIKL
jgi:plastocyanin